MADIRKTPQHQVEMGHWCGAGVWGGGQHHIIQGLCDQGRGHYHITKTSCDHGGVINNLPINTKYSLINLI